ncbi:MAG TPA: SDR family oxidoreductase, partial [Casimicrobiaceae bacterium]|nr:SDR family oxidoreductase [Casimicrobiaceae bacterium]
MAGRLAGKTALITAAGQGIGEATARAMAAEGATVYATDVNPRLLDHYSGVANIQARTLDVLDDAAITALFDELPPVQVLFNCAGFVHNGTILECSPKDWDFTMNLNVRSMYMMIRSALPKMLDHFKATGEWSSIINMASIASSIRGLPNRFVYGVSKAAVVGLTKSIAADYVTKGVRCNAIAPGT